MREAGTHPDETLLVDVAQTPEGAFAVDENRRIVFWNEGARALLGYAADEVLGCTCCDIFGPQDAAPDSGAPWSCPHTPAALVRADVAGMLVRTVAVVATRDGAPRRLRIFTTLARNASGRPRAVHLIRDLDETVRDMERLARALPAPALPAGASATESRDEGYSEGHEVVAATVGERAPAHRGSVPPPRLTRREREVLRLLAAGLSTADIAATLGISPITARNHVTSLIEKLETKTRLQAVVVATRRGLL